MGLAVKAVADGDAKAFISAGNTGALMALGLYFLKHFPAFLAQQSVLRFRRLRVASLCS